VPGFAKALREEGFLMDGGLKAPPRFSDIECRKWRSPCTGHSRRNSEEGNGPERNNAAEKEDQCDSRPGGNPTGYRGILPGGDREEGLRGVRGDAIVG